MPIVACTSANAWLSIIVYVGFYCYVSFFTYLRISTSARILFWRSLISIVHKEVALLASIPASTWTLTALAPVCYEITPCINDNFCMRLYTFRPKMSAYQSTLGMTPFLCDSWALVISIWINITYTCCLFNFCLRNFFERTVLTAVCLYVCLSVWLVAG